MIKLKNSATTGRGSADFRFFLTRGGGGVSRFLIISDKGGRGGGGGFSIF